MGLPRAGHTPPGQFVCTALTTVTPVPLLVGKGPATSWARGGDTLARADGPRPKVAGDAMRATAGGAPNPNRFSFATASVGEWNIIIIDSTTNPIFVCIFRPFVVGSLSARSDCNQLQPVATSCNQLQPIRDRTSARPAAGHLASGHPRSPAC